MPIIKAVWMLCADHYEARGVELFQEVYCDACVGLICITAPSPITDLKSIDFNKPGEHGLTREFSPKVETH
jgi:hypothetical protein